MSDWQPIETAPRDVKVIMGGWYIVSERKDWETRDGVVYESYLFGFLKRRTIRSSDYTHWMPLPEPPK